MPDQELPLGSKGNCAELWEVKKGTHHCAMCYSIHSVHNRSPYQSFVLEEMHVCVAGVTLNTATVHKAA
jgi:hypothetical protein